MNFKKWIETEESQQQGIVSFDFDGVLHTDIVPGTHHPINHYDTDLTPNLPMHQKLHQEAAKNKIVIVSARCPDTKKIISNFCKQYNLPIINIYATCDRPKLPVLLELKAIRHYDDNLKIGQELENSGIEFIPVTVPVNDKMRTISH